MATTEDTVCQAILKCSNFPKSILALLKSLQPELVHRSLIIILNMISLEKEELRLESSIGLCELDLLVIIGIVIENVKGTYVRVLCCAVLCCAVLCCAIIILYLQYISCRQFDYFTFFNVSKFLVRTCLSLVPLLTYLIFYSASIPEFDPGSDEIHTRIGALAIEIVQRITVMMEQFQNTET